MNDDTSVSTSQKVEEMYVLRNIHVLVVATGLSALSLAGTASTCPAQDDTEGNRPDMIWSDVADLPTARLGLATAVVDDKLFAIGGYPQANGAGLRTVEAYDPVNDTWTARSDMPTRRRWLSASAVGGKIYAVGGFVSAGSPSLSTMEEYDVATDSWVTKAPMPTPRKGLSSAVVDGNLYAIGGAASNGQLLTTVEMYDALTDTWSARAPLPSARGVSSASVVDGRIYVTGAPLGISGITRTDAYHPTTDTWTTVTRMPTSRWGFSTTALDGRIYAIGGASGSRSSARVVPTVEEYDHSTDSWVTSASMPRGRWALSASTVDGKIYAVGGARNTGSHPGVSTVQVLTELEGITLGGGETYVQDFDAAFGRDGQAVDQPLPLGWYSKRDGSVSNTITKRFPAPPTSSLGSGTLLYNAGSPQQTDRTLALGVKNSASEGMLQLIANVTESSATAFQLSFDVEAWDAARVSTLGEAAFDVTLELDAGEGYLPLADLGRVTTGAVLSPPAGENLDGNADANRISFDSGIVNASIPSDSQLRVRWSVPAEAEATGWVYGLDNVELGLFGNDPTGDFNGDGLLDVTDVNQLIWEIVTKTHSSDLDLTNDNVVNQVDLTAWVKDVKHTWFGDANLDGEFNSEDMVAVFQAGTYELDEDAGWAEGDWTGDRRFGSEDMVSAFQDGGYELGARAAVSAVPEPSCAILLGIGMIGLRRLRKRR